MLPRRFGRYLLFDRVGKGGMAEIFLARAVTELGAARLVVVKQILPELAGDPAFAQMLIAEAKLAARLRHGNVVQVYELGREGEQLFIAMEYVEGFDLHALLRQLSRTKTALPAEFAIFIVREVLGALSYAHRAKTDDGAPLGLVHRDVSPSNVLISLEGEVKLCDFGIARALSVAHVEAGAAELDDDAGDASGEELAPVSKLAGKSAYMSPEHARGEPVDARADVFAAGILLWELCAGRRMIRGSEAEMLAQARAGVVPALPERGLPEFALLQAVVSRALAAHAGDRFATAADFQRALDGYASKARLVASPLRFGTFLTDKFSADLVAHRRSRERGAQALELGPPVVLERLDGGALAEATATEAATEAQTAADAKTAAETNAAAETKTAAVTKAAAETKTAAATKAAATTPTTTGTLPARKGRAAAWGLALAGLSATALVVAWLAGWLR